MTVSKKASPKKTEVVKGFTIKYHTNGTTVWSKGKIKDGVPEGYWEWYRVDGTIKRSGHFKNGEPRWRKIIRFREVAAE